MPNKTLTPHLLKKKFRDLFLKKTPSSFIIIKMSAEELKPVVEVKSSTASSVKSFLSGGFGGMAAVLVG